MNKRKNIMGSVSMRIPEASLYSGLSESTLRKLTSPKIAELPVVKHGRITLILKSDLDEFLVRKRRPSKYEIEEMALEHEQKLMAEKRKSRK